MITREIIEFSAKEFLQKELADLSPKIIFLLGRTPLRALKSLDSYKGGLSGYKILWNIGRSWGKRNSGLFQRVMVGVFLLWIEVMSIRLFQISKALRETDPNRG